MSVPPWVISVVEAHLLLWLHNNLIKIFLGVFSLFLSILKNVGDLVYFSENSDALESLILLLTSPTPFLSMTSLILWVKNEVESLLPYFRTLYVCSRDVASVWQMDYICFIGVWLISTFSLSSPRVLLMGLSAVFLFCFSYCGFYLIS